MNAMKKIVISFFITLMTVGRTSAQTITEGSWNISLHPVNKTLTISHNGNIIFDGVFAKAKYETDGMTSPKTIISYSAVSTSMTQMAVTDEFGTGQLYTFSYSLTDGIVMAQTFAFYPDLPYFITRLQISKPGNRIKSNYLSPIWTDNDATFLPNDNTKESNRMLFIPWDNDGFVRYQSVFTHDATSFFKQVDSYSVTSIYNAVTRHGIVVGAVDHDTWKNTVFAKSSDYHIICNFHCLSGYVDYCSHDTGVPHGKIEGESVYSSRFVFGLFDDWRKGMETFGEACLKVVPPREWAGGKPVGWNSWGVMGTAVSYPGTSDVANFIKDHLMIHGFHDQYGKVVLSLDSWWNENFTESDIHSFVAYCQASNMIPGLYYCPWADWNSDGGHPIPGTTQYVGRDRWLKANGQYVKVDNAYCNDPTHPATQIQIAADMKKFKSWGIKYIKCDFMSNGAIEADQWFDSNVHTGLQAYNVGMKYMMEQLGNDVYVDLSIAPIFPYQYAHGRRISCDAWSNIANTEYVMNSTTLGWWLNKLYFANDPDHIVLKRSPEATETDGENRARVTSGVITGAFLTGDNFSDQVMKGNPTQSRIAAMKFLTNEDINQICRTCDTFRPVNGVDEKDTGGAGNFFQNETSQYYYFVVFNYSSMPMNGIMTWDRLGIDKNDVGDIQELWSHQNLSPSTEGNGIAYSVQVKDVSVYRIKKKGSTGIYPHPMSQMKIDYKDQIIRVSPSSMVSSVHIYDTEGKELSNSHTGILNVKGFPKGVYLVKALSKNNKIHILKITKQ